MEHLQFRWFYDLGTGTRLQPDLESGVGKVVVQRVWVMGVEGRRMQFRFDVQLNRVVGEIMESFHFQDPDDSRAGFECPVGGLDALECAIFVLQPADCLDR